MRLQASALYKMFPNVQKEKNVFSYFQKRNLHFSRYWVSPLSPTQPSTRSSFSSSIPTHREHRRSPGITSSWMNVDDRVLKKREEALLPICNVCSCRPPEPFCCVERIFAHKLINKFHYFLFEIVSFTSQTLQEFPNLPSTSNCQPDLDAVGGPLPYLLYLLSLPFFLIIFINVVIIYVKIMSCRL